MGHCSCSTLREGSVVHLSVYPVHYRGFQWDTAAAQPYVKGVSYICLCILSTTGCFSGTLQLLTLREGSVVHFVCVSCPLPAASVGHCSCSTLREGCVEHFVCVRCPLKAASVGHCSCSALREGNVVHLICLCTLSTKGCFSGPVSVGREIDNSLS